MTEIGNGGRLNHDGVCRLKFELGGFAFDHEFFVCAASTRHPCKRVPGALRDCDPYGRRLAGVQWERHTAVQQTWWKTARVFVAHHVVIPPRTEAEVPTYVRRCDLPRQPQLFEPYGILWSSVSAVAPRIIFDPLTSIHGSDCTTKRTDRSPSVLAGVWGPSHRPRTSSHLDCVRWRRPPANGDYLPREVGRQPSLMKPPLDLYDICAPIRPPGTRGPTPPKIRRRPKRRRRKSKPSTTPLWFLNTSQSW